MKVKVIQSHPGCGQFPTFQKGTKVIIGEENTHYLHWCACEIAGYETFVPKAFVSDGKLTKEYNPTELIQEAGDLLEVREIIYAWLIATNEKGLTGWIPAEAVLSENGECD